MALQCADIDSLTQTYLDGELTAVDCADLEQHVGHCPGCRARLTSAQAFHSQLRALLAPPAAPAALHDRIEAALEREDRDSQRALRRSWYRTGLAWSLPGTAVVAAAAALTLVVIQEESPRQQVALGSGGPRHTLSSEAVRRVMRRSKVMMEGTPTEISRSMREYLTFPASLPEFRARGAYLLGWRPVELRGRDSAELIYEIKDEREAHRVHVHVLDASDLELGGSDRQVVGNRELWIDRSLGYTVINFKEQDGTGYVFTSDLRPDQLIELIVSSGLVARVGERPHATR